MAHFKEPRSLQGREDVRGAPRVFDQDRRHAVASHRGTTPQAVLSEALKDIAGLAPRLRTSPGTTELRAKVERLLAHLSALDAAEKQKTEASAAAVP